MMDTEVVLKNLGQNIRELRKNKKMTIDELAENLRFPENIFKGWKLEIEIYQ